MAFIKKIFKNNIVISALLFQALEVAGAFLIMAPILVYLRIIMEKSVMSSQLWPVISPDLLSDILLNYDQALGIYALAAIIILFVYLPLKNLMAGGIYNIILFGSDWNSDLQSRTFLERASDAWVGFLKVVLFAAPVYIVVLFLGFIFGNILSHISLIVAFVLFFIFFIMGSSLLQILRIKMVMENQYRLRATLLAIKIPLKNSFWRLVIGNISVSAVALIIVFILWTILKAVRGDEWNYWAALLSFIVQQLMVFIICLAQTLRLNFNYSVIRRGNEDVLG